MLEITPSINRLPPDTLSKIFSLIQPWSIELIHKGGYPWTLSLVCRLWKEITFTTPQLWATIRLEVKVPDVCKLRTRHNTIISALNLCLERSRQYPLTLALVTHDPQTVIPKLIHAFLALCIQHTNHWEHVIFKFPSDLLFPFVSNPALQYPRLRSLLISGLGNFTGITPTDPLMFFNEAPLLSKLTLKRLEYPCVQLRLTWLQITDFRIKVDLLQNHDLFEMLRAMPNLIKLQVDQRSILAEDEQAPSIIELSCLRKLSWRGSESNHRPFFGSVNAPQLEEIEYEGLGRNWDSSIERFLHISGRTLTFVDVILRSVETYRSFISLIPNIETIHLYSDSFNKELLEALTFDQSKPHTIGPSIKRIVLADKAHLQNMLDELVLMIDSRLHVPEKTPSLQKLESVHIRNRVSPEEQFSFWSYDVYNTIFLPLKNRFLHEEDGFSVTYEPYD